MHLLLFECHFTAQYTAYIIQTGLHGNVTNKLKMSQTKSSIRKTYNVCQNKCREDGKLQHMIFSKETAVRVLWQTRGQGWFILTDIILLYCFTGLNCRHNVFYWFRLVPCKPPFATRLEYSWNKRFDLHKVCMWAIAEPKHEEAYFSLAAFTRWHNVTNGIIMETRHSKRKRTPLMKTQKARKERDKHWGKTSQNRRAFSPEKALWCCVEISSPVSICVLQQIYEHV